MDALTDTLTALSHPSRLAGGEIKQKEGPAAGHCGGAKLYELVAVRPSRLLA